MRHGILAALAAGALAFSLSAYAQTPPHSHEGGGHNHDHGGMNHEEHHRQHHGDGHSAQNGEHNHANMCEAIISKNEVRIPNLFGENWELVKSVKKEIETMAGKRGFVYFFFKDSRVLGAKVTLAESFTPYGADSIRTVMWEEGDKKMIMVEGGNNDLDVCVMPLYGSDEKRYDIEWLMEKVSAWADKK